MDQHSSLQQRENSPWCYSGQDSLQEEPGSPHTLVPESKGKKDKNVFDAKHFPRIIHLEALWYS